MFHAARQDLEIFFVEGGVIPQPLFDTQVAAMVCGFGEQAGYETLVRKIAKEPLDKTSRFTDWSRRPLTRGAEDLCAGRCDASAGDLRTIWRSRSKSPVARNGSRKNWQMLTNPETYVVHPEEAWERVKTRTNSGKFLAIVRELARFREDFARSRNVPRTRVYKDDALLELASTKPATRPGSGPVAAVAARGAQGRDRRRHPCRGQGRD